MTISTVTHAFHLQELSIDFLGETSIFGRPLEVGEERSEASGEDEEEGDEEDKEEEDEEDEEVSEEVSLELWEGRLCSTCGP